MRMEHQRYDTEEAKTVKDKPVSVPFCPKERLFSGHDGYSVIRR
jgi:hypothetical protein